MERSFDVPHGSLARAGGFLPTTVARSTAAEAHYILQPKLFARLWAVLRLRYVAAIRPGTTYDAH